MMTDLSEARFTPPSETCPHPEYWTSMDEQSTENEVLELVAGFIRALQPEFVIETGSAYGYGARVIGRALQENGHGRLVTLEVDGDRWRVARMATAHLPVTCLRQSSETYVPEQTIDFVWFDSLFELRVGEFRAYYPYMTNRTIVGFHDTADHHPVGAEIRVLQDEGLITPIYLPTPRGVVFAQVHRDIA
jgi:predicted O-methyltransferase YrrM